MSAKTLLQRVEHAQSLQDSGRLAEAAEAFQGLLSEAADREGDNVPDVPLSGIHLRLAQCFRGVGDLKAAVSACSSALECVRSERTPYWSLCKDIHLFRSECLRSLYASFQKFDGDDEENIERDRKEADVIVTTDYSLPRDPSNDNIVVTSLGDALEKASDGQKIFLETGKHSVKEANSLFLLNKSVTIVGASTSRCIIEYRKRRCCPDKSSAALDTFLICGGGLSVIKRVTFRYIPEDDAKEDQDLSEVDSSLGGASGKSLVSSKAFLKCKSTKAMTTRFIGLAAGCLSLEDCVFDGSACPEDVDAVYSSSKICGTLAEKFPRPRVSARFCVFDHCSNFAAFTTMHADANIRFCLFLDSRVSAMSGSSLSITDSEFSHEHGSVSASGVNSLHLRRCYFDRQIHSVGDHYKEEWSSPSPSHVVSFTGCATSEAEANYIRGCGEGGTNGLVASDSDLVCSGNLVEDCGSSKRTARISKLLRDVGLRNGDEDRRLEASVETSAALVGLNTGFSLRGSGRKISLNENCLKRCDVAVYIGRNSSLSSSSSSVTAPITLKSNLMESSSFAGVFAECGAKPNILGNKFHGETNSSVLGHICGLGVLLVLDCGGLIGKNSFKNYEVSPIMTFASCRPLIRGNVFEKVAMDKTKQGSLEQKMREWFCGDLFRRNDADNHFYVVTSISDEEELRDVIYKGTKSIEEMKL